jgi:hypothetical protein
MLVGYLRDRTGSYDTGFALLVCAALAGAVAIGLLPGRREPMAVPSPQSPVPRPQSPAPSPQSPAPTQVS